MKNRRMISIVVPLLALTMIGGCAAPGKVKLAGENFQRAEAIGAEQKAPYEYYSAKAYLDLAKHELKDSDNKNAGIYADRASSFAEQAINKSGGAK